MVVELGQRFCSQLKNQIQLHSPAVGLRSSRIRAVSLSTLIWEMRALRKGHREFAKNFFRAPDEVTSLQWPIIQLRFLHVLCCIRQTTVHNKNSNAFSLKQSFFIHFKLCKIPIKVKPFKCWQATIQGKGLLITIIYNCNILKPWSPRSVFLLLSCSTCGAGTAENFSKGAACAGLYSKCTVSYTKCIHVVNL